MDISRFKHQHVEILEGIDKLRQLSRAGVKDNAKAIAARLNALSQVIIQHLAIEDRILYPRLERGQDQDLVELSRRFRIEMADVANPFINFSRKWEKAAAVAAKPEEFRKEANTVLRRVYERMRQEDREFYPVIEAADFA